MPAPRSLPLPLPPFEGPKLEYRHLEYPLPPILSSHC